MTADEFDEIFEPKEYTGRHRSDEPMLPETQAPEQFWSEKEKRVELPSEDITPDPQLILEQARAKATGAQTLPEPAPIPHEPGPSMPGVKEVIMAQPMDLSQPDPHAKGPWIQYNGVATVRIMDRNAWADAGVNSTRYCEWNYLNGKRLPRALFSDEELQYLLRVDGRFSLEVK